ncbi:helix-turn-helix transcriptional regulator [Nocardia sp. CDC159]|uniref:Helix-turn-helix transcriptional regulator n=1 Tax=Nocardia pulmonis TaxID=2951408 RepID=A0A9X2EGY0_9NOCA|nr:MULTISPECIES: helix-turn-helix transcriptional regulator [Nocardia]MCM6778003.1 helix-turn-helix transcriptional regulator [Nocardia pulmonis]MCM6790826.1 helix-turn-helix transcriptional regulator [Nocardia sp. CDC159]
MATDEIGVRIAHERKLRGLTQAQLAARIQYSLSYLRKVERGVETPSEGFKAAVVAALGVDPAQLSGAPYLATLEEDGPIDGLEELRVILAEGSFVRGIEPPGHEELGAELRSVQSALRSDRTRAALAQIPDLLRKLYGALESSHEQGERSRIYKMLCETYIAAEGALCRLGFTSLLALVLDRLDWAAAQADDSGYVVRSMMKRARLLMAHGSLDVAMSLVERGLGMIVGGGEAEQVLRGYGHLRGAIVAARDRQLETATDHIREARRIAQLIGHESDIYTTEFGPGNVEIHACAVELEAGDPGKAARQGAMLYLPADVAAPRAGHHWQDNARAWLMTGKPDEALKALNKARSIAPQQTKLHPSVRDTLYGIAAQERFRNDSLGNFARWVGVTL